MRTYSVCLSGLGYPTQNNLDTENYMKLTNVQTHTHMIINTIMVIFCIDYFMNKTNIQLSEA